MNPYNFVAKGDLLLRPGETLECVSKITGIPISDMQIPDKEPGSRRREFVVARHTFCWIMKNYTRRSLATIGANILRDHATVLHGVKTINNLIETDKNIRQLIGKVISECYSKDAEARQIYDNKKTESIENLKSIHIKPKDITCSIQWSDENGMYTKAYFEHDMIQQMLNILNNIYKKPTTHVFSYKTRKSSNNQRRYSLLQKGSKTIRSRRNNNFLFSGVQFPLQARNVLHARI